MAGSFILGSQSDLISDVEEKVMEWSKDKLEEKRVLLYNENKMPISSKEIGTVPANLSVQVC